MTEPARRSGTTDVRISPLGLEGVLGLPRPARGLVVFAHGSGSGRFSPRNNYVAGKGGVPAHVAGDRGIDARQRAPKLVNPDGDLGSQSACFGAPAGASQSSRCRGLIWVNARSDGQR